MMKPRMRTAVLTVAWSMSICAAFLCGRFLKPGVARWVDLGCSLVLGASALWLILLIVREYRRDTAELRLLLDEQERLAKWRGL